MPGWMMANLYGRVPMWRLHKCTTLSNFSWWYSLPITAAISEYGMRTAVIVRHRLGLNE
jgi:hypothetical protein